MPLAAAYALTCAAIAALAPSSTSAQGHLACAEGEQWDTGLCYPACDEGYEGDGPTCWQACYPPATGVGPYCTSDGFVQAKLTYDRGSGTVPAAVDAQGRDRCPDGQEWDVTSGRCYDPCADGYYGLISTCWQYCPAGYTSDGAVCRKDAVTVARPSYGRGAGTTPNQCASYEDYDAGLCYPGCGRTYAGVGPVCWERCSGGYTESGPICWKDISHFYFKSSYGRGAGTVPKSCTAGKELDAGLCYPTCAAGYSGIGPVCWGSCPGGYTTQGALCGINADITAKKSYDRGAGSPAPCGSHGRQYDEQYSGVLPAFENAETFTLLIASDPQLVRWSSINSPTCPDDACKLAKSQHANANQVDAMNAIDKTRWSAASQIGVGTWPASDALPALLAGAPIKQPLGVIMNGDLTEYWHSYQEELYRTYYEPGYARGAEHVLQWPIFPGLGNHDYDNNLDDCFDNTADGNHCAKRAVEYIKEMVYCDSVSNFINTLVQSFDENSLAYSWDIGTYHFVQLHNYPTYESDKIGISDSIDWLTKDVARATARGRKIVLNFHDSDFDSTPTVRFLKAIEHANVVAIFTGHYHDEEGYFGSFPSTNIPLFRSGASEFSTFLLAEFGPDHISVGVIESHAGQATFADTSNPLLPSNTREEREAAARYPDGRQINLYNVRIP